MWKEKYEQLCQTHQTLIEDHDALAARVRELEILIDDHNTSAHGHAPRERSNGSPAFAGPSAGKPVTPLSGTQEEIYRYIIRRAEEDPRLLKILTTKRELLVQIETPTLEVDGRTLRGGLALLIHKGFFATPKNGNTAFNELQRLGQRASKRNVYHELDGLAELGFLTKEDGGYQATELKVSVKRA